MSAISIPDLGDVSIPENMDEMIQQVLPDLTDEQVDCLVEQLGDDFDLRRPRRVAETCNIEPVGHAARADRDVTARFDAIWLDAGGVLVLPDPTVLGPLLAYFGGSLDIDRHRRAHYAAMAVKSAQGAGELDWREYDEAYVAAVGVAPADVAAAAEPLGRTRTALLWRWPIPESLEALAKLDAGRHAARRRVQRRRPDRGHPAPLRRLPGRPRSGHARALRRRQRGGGRRQARSGDLRPRRRCTSRACARTASPTSATP